MKEYSDYTYNSANPLAKFSHRRRFKFSSSLIGEFRFNHLLDYGAGDLQFLKSLILSGIKDKMLTAYEPVMENEPVDEIEIITDSLLLFDKKYDLITCFEVLEHFNENGQFEILSNFLRLMEKGGHIIISVPIEIGPPSIIKNLRRIANGDFNRTYIHNSWKSFLGKEVPTVRNVEGYLPTHIGFNHKRLEKLMASMFEINNIYNSPFQKLPSSLNSQRFYVLSNKLS